MHRSRSLFLDIAQCCLGNYVATFWHGLKVNFFFFFKPTKQSKWAWHKNPSQFSITVSLTVFCVFILMLESWMYILNVWKPVPIFGVEACNLITTTLLYVCQCASWNLKRHFPLHFLIRVEMMKPKPMQVFLRRIAAPTGMFPCLILQ